MKLAFGVKDLAHSQLAYYLVREANKFLSKHYDTDITVFFEEPSCSVATPLFSTMQFAEAWAFDGVLVSTSLSTARKALGFPCVKKRFFYVYEFEWLQPSPVNFRYFQQIYANSKHKLLARTEEHADILADLWNIKRPLVVDEKNVICGIIKEMKW